MKLAATLAIAIFSLQLNAAETKPAAPKPAAPKPAGGNPPAKPAPKPAAKPKPKPKPKAPAKPQPTVKELAIAEAKKADANRNGKIEGAEVSVLRGAYAKDPKSWLYIFDDNSNKMLDDAEISKIEFPAAPAPKPAPKKK